MHPLINMPEREVLEAAGRIYRQALLGILDNAGEEMVEDLKRLRYSACRRGVERGLRKLKSEIWGKELRGEPLTPTEEIIKAALVRSWNTIIDTICDEKLNVVREEMGRILTYLVPITEALEEPYEEVFAEEFVDIMAAIKRIVEQVV